MVNNAGGLSYENQAFLVIGHQMFAVLIEDSHRGGVNKKTSSTALKQHFVDTQHSACLHTHFSGRREKRCKVIGYVKPTIIVLPSFFGFS